jgi:hypothetical protein
MEDLEDLKVQPWEHFKKGMLDFIRIDRMRLFQLLGIFQYTILYGLVCFYLGSTLESFFPDADEAKSSWTIAVEVLGQCFILAVSLFYIRIFIKAVPAIPTFFLHRRTRGHGDLSTASYRFSEYQGELIVAIIFIGVQLNLLTKISILAKRFLNMLGREKTVLRLK